MTIRTIDEFKNALEQLIHDYAADTDNALEDIAWLLETSAKNIRAGDYDYDEKK